MAIVEIPTRNDITSYKYRIELDDSFFSFIFNFNGRRGRWYLDILNANDEPVVNGICLLNGVNLLQQYRHLNIPKGDLFVFDTKETTENPDRETFSTRFRLLYKEVD
ncbi:MAG: hypothetical protein GY817_04675 [bacterium]|nr:hypothetical protein [bacterium]